MPKINVAELIKEQDTFIPVKTRKSGKPKKWKKSKREFISYDKREEAAYY